jgi:lipoic acid synthetase
MILPGFVGVNMQKLVNIPIVVESGKKYQTEQGFSAIKDGIKTCGENQEQAHLPKPAWLRIKATHSPNYEKLKSKVHELKLATVCEEAKCPNISECWSHGTATIMLMGAVCTRACRFCAVDTGNPKGWLDPNEPEKTAETVEMMNLDYVVLTSVNRDDLSDGGASHYAQTIKAIKASRPQTKVEALAPDFQGNEAAIRCLMDSGLDVFAQNLETVERLTHPVRDIRASYQQTLKVLQYAKNHRPQVLTKTSLILGIGETLEEIEQAMNDLRAHSVDILTLGQYLQPTKNHLPIVRYLSPDEFSQLRELGLSKGFYEVASGPMVRSSYRADRVFHKTF